MPKGLTIDWCEDIKSYKKLIPTLKKYPDAIIVTADDDLIYDNKWLEQLYNAAQIFENIDCDAIDTCLIDGRFRVACAIQTILKCQNIKFLMIHDYTFREYYHIIEEFLDIVEIIDTLAIFEVKLDVDTEKLKQLYEEYKYIKE